MVLPPWGHLAVSGDVFGCHYLRGVLLACRGQKPGCCLNHRTQRIIQSRMSVALTLIYLDLNVAHFGSTIMECYTDTSGNTKEEVVSSTSKKGCLHRWVSWKKSYVWAGSWKAERRDGPVQKGWSWEGKFSTQPSEHKNGCVKLLLIFGGYKKSGMCRTGLRVQKSEFGQLSRSPILRAFSLPFFTFFFSFLFFLLLFLFLFCYVRELGFLLKGVGSDERFQAGTSHF